MDDRGSPPDQEAGEPRRFPREEAAILAFLSARLGAPRSMVDVGAHRGTTLEPFLRAGFDVTAFEPIDSNRRVLEDRFGAFAGLTIRSEAVSAESGEARLQLALRDDGSEHEFFHSLEDLPEDRHHQRGETVTVATACLDDLASNGQIPRRVGVLKIDTEGHDLAVLRGAETIRADVVSVEFWGPEHPLGEPPSPLSEMGSLLADRGYPHCLVVARHEGSVSFGFTADDVAEQAAWGNAFFFHEGAGELFDAASAFCGRGWASHPTPLEGVLSRYFDPSERIAFYDVGAFRGDFAFEVLQYAPASSGVLFEPAPGNAEPLGTRCGLDPRLSLKTTALSDTEGEAAFNWNDDAPATGSLLEPRHGQSTEIVMSVTTLDAVWEQAGRPRVDLLKVDTQGTDLAVLQGARELIRSEQPVLIVEAIFTPLYADQPEPFEIFEFVSGVGYRVARLLNVHNTRADELAFLDLVLVPRSRPPQDLEPPFVPWDADDAARWRERALRAIEQLKAQRQTIQRLRSQLQRRRAARQSRAGRQS